MFLPLLRRLGLLPKLVLLLLGLAAAHPALATHLLGGELTYKYLNANGPANAPYRYEITVTVYNNCGTSGIASPSTTAPVAIYDQATGARIILTATNYSNLTSGNMNIPVTSQTACISPTPPPGCTIQNATQPYILQKFIATVSLPASSQGYYAVWTASARNTDVYNLGTNQSMTLYTTIAPPTLPNSSPVFASDAIALICLNDTTTLLNNAVDADGDRLVYSFGQPYGTYPTPNTSGMPTTTFAQPPAIGYSVPNAPSGTFAVNTPMGTTAGNFALINQNTGTTKYGSTLLAKKYVVAVDVSEYRTINNRQVLIGTTRRDLQLIVGTCPSSTAPALPSASSTPRAYTIEAGSTLNVTLGGTQIDGHPLTLTVSSVLLDGAGNTYNATFNNNPGTLTAGNPAGSVITTGATGNVSGNFVFTPTCTQARSTPYDVAFVVQDNNCGGKTVSDIIRITVVKPSGPTAIAGDLTVCGIPSQHTYTASGGTAPVSWRVVGGTIVGSSTANPVTINWTTAGTGTLVARGLTQYGCLTDSVSIPVNVGQAPTLTVTGNTSICQGSSTTLSVASGATSYTVTSGGTTVATGPGPFVLSPAATTIYTISAVTTGTTCGATSQVTVTVTPPPTATAGAATTVCTGGSTQLGAPAVAGLTYSWSPSTGLSSATVANPTVTLTNPTSAPITQTYTLTVTNAAGCTNTATVAVTVNPPLAAAAGSNATICSGASTQLGAPSVTGLTYSWSPATGLSSATAANPTVTLTNTTSAPTTQTYTLTITDAAGCTGTGTVTVTVNPAPTAVPGAALAFCSGGSGQLGAPAVTGLTYSWSPATGLSSATVANPTVTLTNTTSAPITQTYTLTVTGAGSCTSTGTVVVTVNPIPVATAGPALAICSGGSGQLGAPAVTGLTYSWSPATGLSSATVANPTVTLTNTTSAPITQTYTLTVTGAGSCTSTGTVVVTVNPLPTAVPGAALAFCSGGSGQLGAPAVTGLTYSWSPATGLSSATVANPTVTLTNTTSAPTTQTYTLTVTNTATSCTSTGTVVVTVNPLPTAVPGTALAICSGSSGQLGAPAVTGLTYSWSPAPGLSSVTVANPTVTLTNSTSAPITQTYTLTVTGVGNCTSTGTVVVTVNPLPTAVPGAAVAFCSGGSGQLGAPSVTGLTYSWSPSTGLSDPTVANPTVTLTNPTTAATTQTYTLTVTGPGTCTSTGTVVVTVNPLPTAVPGSALAFCSGGSGQLGAAAVPGNTYSWSPATGLSSATVANPTVTLTNPTTAATTQTYTLTVTNATGCVSTGTVAVTVNPIPVAVPGAAVAICAGASAPLGGAPVTGLTYSWSPATGLSSATAANPTVTLTNTTAAATTQTYTLTVTGAGNCTSTGTVVVTVNPLPTAVPGSAVAFCSGGSGQLGAPSVTGLTYSWSPATGLSSATAANPTVTLTNTTGTATTQTYTLTVTNTATSCTSTGTVVVTVNPIPVATAGPALAICSGSSGQLGAAAVPGNTYSWSPATGLSSATTANPTVTLTNTTSAPITQTYTLTVTSAAGCTSTGTVVVTVNPLPTAVPGAALAFCSGGSGQLGAPSVTGLTYSWSPATGLSSATAANPTVTLTNTTSAPTTQTYTLTVTNTATSCTSTGTVVVTVNPLPTAVPGAAVAFCSGGSGQLGAPAVTGLTYSWSPATGLSSATVANPTVTLTNTTAAATTQTYTLTVTNATGCVSTGTVVVTVNPIPAAVPGAAVAICAGGSAQLGAPAVTGLTYSWSPATGLSSATVANPTVTLTNPTTAATTQTYTLTVTSAAGCTSTGTVVVTVNPLPVATAGAAVTICSGNTTQLGASPVAGLTYSWSPATGLSNAALANPTLTLTNVSPTGTAIAPTYTLTVTNPATGCVNTSSVVVTVNAEILPGIIGPNQTVCASFRPVPLTSTPGPSGGYGTYAYQWEVSSDNLTWTTLAGATTDTYAPGQLATTLYFRRRVTSGSCAEQVSNSVKLELQPQVTPTVTLATPATQCAGTALTFTPVPTNAGPAPTFQWYVNNALVATSPTYTSSTLRNGDVVRVEVVPTAGFCATTQAVASVTVNLTPVSLPTISISPRTALPACASTPVVFAVDSIGSPGATLTYQWQVDGVSVAGATAPTFTSSTLSAGQVVTLLVSTSSACGQLTATSNPLAVVIVPNVDVEAGPDKTIMEGESVELEGTASGNFPVTWTPTPTLAFPGNNPLRPMASPTVTTTYTLAAKVGDCTDESQVTITVTPRVRIPNAFSPNGDGLDDTWEIDRIAEYPSNHVIIFNRWGNKLFETTNYSRGNQWNGTINGQPAPLGTYYYLITLGNGKSYSGPLTIVY